MSDRGKLGSFLKEVIDWNWKQFCEAEIDTNYTGYQAAVFALIRTCSEGKLGAIKLAIDRVDGKVETPIKFEYPKVFLLFPEAQSVALPAKDDLPPKLTTSEPVKEKPKEEPVKVTTMTLRQTLQKMAEQKRLLVKLILSRKKEVEMGSVADEKNIPLVKSVIAANLLNLAEKNNFEAIMEIFDQIDGKLVETIRILGDDLYLSSYALVAPYGARKNKDGVYQLEAPQIAQSWKQRLKKD